MLKIKRWLKLVQYVVKRYVADNCSNSAAALTYMTLFAVVPLFTVMYAILSAVPAFQEVGLQIQGLIFDHFVPSTGQEVEQYLKTFSTKARKLTGIGVAFLGITAILMLKNIEQTFNAIWKTRENRHGLSSFLLYWAILSLGPLFIGMALAISTYLLSLNFIVDQVDVIGIGPELLRLSPYVLTSAAFTLLFAAVPNCKVPIKNALAGGLITGLIFECAKQLFTGIVSNTSYQTIYGTFATFPLFLLWIYVSWLIVLAGAELTHAIGNYNDDADENYSDLVLSLAVLELLWRHHQQGLTLKEHKLLQTNWLFNRHSLSADRWPPIRERLFSGGLVTTAESGDFVLARDLHQFSLWDLYCLLGYPSGTHLDAKTPPPDWFRQCIEPLNKANENNQQWLAISLASLFVPKQNSSSET